ncbi:VOC family protein [Streptomyces olivaceus]|uniref:VOC family protein n=1 Tax=Streptomyces olivaceus TaxID=47716 RepID=UPI0018A7FAB1|nr:VOC family protein [Streptomyces olivaceus]MBF8172309.1 VOC family protein [Streptomyces olivaceus]
MKLHEPVPGGPCWAELGTTDLGAARRFYTKLFGWRPETDSRQQAGGYTIARVDGRAVAALTPLYQREQPVAWNVSFAVGDADAAVRQVAAAGGAVTQGPTDVFESGRFAVAVDPTGALFQLWQPGTFPGAGLFNAPGSLGWVELLTREPGRAADFYTTVFGWSVDVAARCPRWGIGGADFGGMVTMDEKFPHEVPAHWLPYFAVADVNTAAVDTTDGGGTVLMEPTSVPDRPRLAVLRDPQGAMFGVYRAGGER